MKCEYGPLFMGLNEKCVYDGFRDFTVDSTALPLQSPGASLRNKRHVMTGSLCGAVKYNLVL